MTDGASRTLPWRAVLTATGIDAISILPGFLVASLAVRLHDDLGLTPGDLGVVIGVFFGSAAIASVPAGRLAERIGWAPSLRIAALLASVAMAAIALLAHSAWALLWWCGIGGLASALAHPASNLAVARCAPVQRRGFVFGVKHAAVPASTMLGGLAVPSLALTMGWRWAFVAGALLGVTALLLVPHPAPPAGGEREIAPEAPAPPRPMQRRLLLMLAVAVGLGVGGIDALASFIVSYAVEIGIPEGTAGLVLAAGSIAGIVTRIVTGFSIDRRVRSDLSAVVALLLAGAGGIALLTLDGLLAFYVGGLIAFVGCWGWSGLFTFAVVRDHEHSPAAATAVTQAGKLVGAGLGPLAFGLLVDARSYESAWWATTGVLVLSAATMFTVSRLRPQRNS